MSQESYLVWECSVVCMILYLNIFQCIVCLEYVLNLWDSVILLKFLEMDSWKWMVTGGHVYIWVRFCRTGKMLVLCLFFLKSRASVRPDLTF